MNNIRKISITLKTAVAFFILLSAEMCTAKPIIAVTIPPQKWIVQQLAGDSVDVLLILPPGQNPHTFEPSPGMLTKLSKADAWFTIGMPFEETVEKRVRAITGPRLTITNVSDNDEKEHVHEHSEHQCDHDPHKWLSTCGMAQIASNTAAVLTSLSPSDTMSNALDNVTAKIAATRAAAIKLLSNAKSDVFWVQHPSWGFFAEDFGLIQKSLEVNGSEPTPRQLARLVDDAKRIGVKTLFANPQHDKRMLEIMAEQIGAKVDELDPLAENWPENIVVSAKKIAEASK